LTEKHDKHILEVTATMFSR